jgi:hypothetical protein
MVLFAPLLAGPNQAPLGRTVETGIWLKLMKGFVSREKLPPKYLTV